MSEREKKSEVASARKRIKSKKPGVKKPEEEDNSPPVGQTGAFNISQSKIENKSEIVNPKSQNMEVHHHPEVEKKGLKEYVLEGLMIFLAVTMGFFAEGLREHISENKRAKEYAVTLYNDLKADTAELNEYLTYFRFATANTDTLMQLLSAINPKQIPSGKLYWFGLYGGAYHIFTPHDATLLEMKSSGSLRYFANVSLNRKLAQYDELCQNMKTLQENDQGIYTEVRKARAQLFDFKYNRVADNISHIKKGPVRQAKIDSFIKTNPPLLSYDKILFNEYVEMVRSRFFSRKVDAANILLKNASKLIAALKKEYNLESE
jgi:hypothetical protein